MVRSSQRKCGSPGRRTSEQRDNCHIQSKLFVDSEAVRISPVQRAGGWFGLTREATGGLINHDLRTALISPEGKLVRVWKSNAWTPYEVHRSVRETLTGSIDVAKR